MIFIPGFFEEDAVLVLFELAEIGVDPRLDGTLPQEPGAKRMDRPDEGPLEAHEGRVEPGPDRGVLLLEPRLFQRDLETPPELRRRLAGEGHGGQRIDGRPARSEQGDHAVNEAFCLPRSCPRLDQERRAQVALDPVADRLVGRRPLLRAHHLYSSSLS